MNPYEVVATERQKWCGHRHRSFGRALACVRLSQRGSGYAVVESWGRRVRGGSPATRLEWVSPGAPMEVRREVGAVR